jgi:hypothetical protein
VRGPSVKAERVDRFQRIASRSLAAAADSAGRLVQSEKGGAYRVVLHASFKNHIR